MNKILEHIENRIKELSVTWLKAKINKEHRFRAFIEGQIKVYDELYTMLWEQEQKIAQRANTQQETR